MIVVKSLNTPIATFDSLSDLAQNFKPAWGKLQDYWYIEGERYISWLKVADKKREYAK